MTDNLISTAYSAELRGATARVLTMGQLALDQVENAIQALLNYRGDIASQVLHQEARVNALEVEIDREITTTMALRQPTARDLRLLIAISKTTANLERVGDEASRIARTVHRLINNGALNRSRLPMADLAHAARTAGRQLRMALDAFERHDTSLAADVIRDDRTVDLEFDGLMRRLVTHMMEDARIVSSVIDLVFVAKAIERIGDHAKNVAEQAIYSAKGTDVRHWPVEAVEAVGAVAG